MSAEEEEQRQPELSSPTKRRPTKSIQSILTDHLDAIKEGSEHSESSHSNPALSTGMDNTLAVGVPAPPASPSKQQRPLSSSSGHHKSSSPRKSSSSSSSSKEHGSHHSSSSSGKSSSRGSSPRRKIKTKDRPAQAPTVLIGDVEQQEGVEAQLDARTPSAEGGMQLKNGSNHSSKSSSRSRRRPPSAAAQKTEEDDGHSSGDGTYGRVRSTSDTGTSDDNDTGDEGDASDVTSDSGDEEGSLESPLDAIAEGRTPKKLSLQEKLNALDPNSSVMMFDFDGEIDDDATGHGDMSVRSLPIMENQEELTWRLDPSESMSDWTLRVYNKGTKTTDEYHVHKNILAVGKRRSEYFVNIFRQRGRNSTDDPVSEVVLVNRAAVAVPVLLDYMYTSNEAALQLTSDVAPGLRFLSQFFGVRQLFDRVMRFIQRDLSLKTMVAYYRASRELEDKKISNLVVKHCARNIQLIDTNHELIQVIDPELFSKVLSSPGLDERKMHVSLLVTKYCQLHRDHLNSETFLAITHESNLPVVHHTAAISLMGIEADLVVPTSIASMMGSMTDLQERCIKGLSAHWRELTEQDPEQTTRVCRKLPSSVVTELLLRSLEHAKKEGDRQAQNAVLARNVKTQKAKPKPGADGSKSKTEHEAAMEALKKEYEEKLTHLQDVCYEKDKHIKNYYQELNKFERLPNGTEGKIVQSGRKEQPTVMPTIGKHSKEGYLLSGKKLGGAKFPLFYYKDGSS